MMDRIPTDRKTRAALRAYFNARSQLMRMWSLRDEAGLERYVIPPDSIWGDIQRRCGQRMKQATMTLLKKIGWQRTQQLIDEKDALWKKSGAWRQDVWRKPDPKIVAAQEKLQSIHDDLKNPATWDNVGPKFDEVFTGITAHLQDLMSQWTMQKAETK